MRRRHMASDEVDKTTLCGHSATVQEFRRMKKIKPEEVTCQRCLNIYSRIQNKGLHSEEQVKLSAKT
jgi:hypothetical protein|tara:strand:- start:39 stop:239 length:201 start_codon:yes stop_codon:yes gene_type:complete